VERDLRGDFKALADEGRFEIAMHMLRNTSLGVQEIAAALDYAGSLAREDCPRCPGFATHTWRGSALHERR